MRTGISANINSPQRLNLCSAHGAQWRTSILVKIVAIGRAWRFATLEAILENFALSSVQHGQLQMAFGGLRSWSFGGPSLLALNH
jgi:hypothetical protein